jgi:hypothetical protein
MENIETALRELMNKRCASMHNPSMRCYGKGCDGQCAQFQMAVQRLTDFTTQFPEICKEHFEGKIGNFIKPKPKNN